MSVRKRVGIAFALVVTATLRLAAFGTAEISIGDSPALVTGSYDYSAELALPEIVTIGVSGGITAPYALGFSEGLSGDFDNRQLSGPAGALLDYQIFNSTAARVILKDLVASPDASNLLTGTAIIGGTQVNFEVAVLQGQIVPPGSYSDTVSVLLYEGTNGSDGLKETAIMPISIDVPAFVSVSLAPTGGEFDPMQDAMTLDFGVLTQGSSRDMDVLVRANVDYAVDLESAHAGALAITDPGDPSTVPYQLTVNGATANLAGGAVTVVQDTGPTTLSGNRYQLVFTIGNPGNATSGAYGDEVTVTVTAQ